MWFVISSNSSPANGDSGTQEALILWIDRVDTTPSSHLSFLFEKLRIVPLSLLPTRSNTRSPSEAAAVGRLGIKGRDRSNILNETKDKKHEENYTKTQIAQKH